ncbi:sensor histidine kinase [Paenibacillus ihumii]|uniref:sensor histidine kinase n=1 Tax=Paenibacillus ihumii TaxID=687436 RepID=UPI001E336E2D|nr:histidine kinase [Paenibacillus ihumii]
MTEKSIRENTNYLTLGGANLQSYFTGIHELAMSIYSGINIPDSLYTAILSAKPHDLPDAGPIEDLKRNVFSSQLLNMFQSNKDIYQIHLFVNANKQSNTLLKGFFRREYNDSYRPPVSPSGKVEPYIEVSHPDHRYGMKSGIPNLKPGLIEVFSAHYPIYRTPSDEAMGYLSIDFRLSELEEISKSMNEQGAEQIFLLNEQGEALYSSDPDLIGKTIKAGWSKVPSEEEDGHFSWKDERFEGIVFYRAIQSPLFKGYLLKLVPYDNLYGDAKTITRITTGIGILFLIIGMIAAILISIRFTNPIKRLISFTQKVQTGDMEARVEVVTEDEFGILTRKINNMTQTINNLILKEYKLEIANKSNQLKALQAQINPHFLYNALQSIATMSLKYKALEVYERICALGSMMRYTMATGINTVTLQEEVEHAEHYLMLQKERFGEENLEVHFDIAEETRMQAVPKMILQPLVENIFKHAFEDGIVSGRIRVHMVSRLDEAGNLSIAVSDNGRKLPPERVLEMESAINAEIRNEIEQIGLRNVLARLRLYFGKEASLTMRGHEKGGLTVSLWIPTKNYISMEADKGESTDRR